MQTAANYYIYMEMEGARMIQKEKIRGVGYFLMALAAGLLPFAAPDACAQALREGLALCGGPLLLSLDRKSTRLKSSHCSTSRMPSSA